MIMRGKTKKLFSCWCLVLVISIVLFILTLVVQCPQCFALDDAVKRSKNENQATTEPINTDAGNTTKPVKVDSEATTTNLNTGKLLLIRPPGPSEEYEISRRRLATDLRNTWWNVRSQLQQLNVSKNDSNFEKTAYHFRVVQEEVSSLGQVDGFASWRKREAMDLSDLVQQRLYRLQNPANCTRAKKVACMLDRNFCGFGCQIHHVVYCFLMAYGSGRTLVLNSTGWRYEQGGWEEIFMPLSDTCTTYSNHSYSEWPGTRDTQTIMFPLWDKPKPRPKPDTLPLAIPKDIAERLVRLHGNPGAWWVGQFLKYMFRLQPSMQEMVNNITKILHFQHPIVGVHIRRTDKVRSEAKYYSLEEYMDQVENYYAARDLQHPNYQRIVYLATDDDQVFDEAVKKYPTYVFLYNQRLVHLPRYNPRSLRALLVDILLLARSSFLVCTLSSNLGRLAFEVMQTLHSDASDKCYSLDSEYYFYQQRPRLQWARDSHDPHNKSSLDLTLEKGDLIQVAFRTKVHGLLYGKNQRTTERGFYPSIKGLDIVDIVDVKNRFDDPTIPTGNT